MYINMDNGFAWIEIKLGSEIGNTFEYGVFQTSQIKHEYWSKFFSAPIEIKIQKPQKTPSGGQSDSEAAQTLRC